MPKRFLAVQALIKNYAHTPNVDFAGNLGRIFANHETFWWQVPKNKNNLFSILEYFIIIKVNLPISAGSLRG